MSPLERMEVGVEKFWFMVYSRAKSRSGFCSLVQSTDSDKLSQPQLHPLNKRETDILTRLSAGRTDQQIADELFLSLNTVKWYNRQIYSKLGIKSRTQAIACAQEFGLLEHSAPLSLSGVMTSSNLPAASTRFIGRGREIADVKQSLDTSRLLTLTGTGGTGKTRLALRIAADVAESFADGVYFIDLAPLSDHTLVPKAIAWALGVLENPKDLLLETLKRAIAERELLLLIDNFEHVIEAAPLLAELLAASPRLKILVTSRESLRLSGEQEYPVPPLSLPAPGSVSVQQLIESEAGALFVQRAQMTQPRFVATEENAPAIAQICTRLDGLPLALELAAARCKFLTPQILLERLEGTASGSPLPTLSSGPRDAPPRQRTLRASIEWSYNLLDEADRTLLVRLAVFRGGTSLEAIEAVCAEGLSKDIFEGLASLVDKSLLQQKEIPNGELRFVMLEMIRAYGRERLEASSELEIMHRLHATYFVAMTERAEPELRLTRYDDWCERFELDWDNIRAALEWTVRGGDVTLGVRLAGALGLFWYGKGHHVEGTRWTRELLERYREAPTSYHARFLISAGHMAWMHDLEIAQRLLREAFKISRELDDKLQMAWALVFLGYTMQQEPEAAQVFAERALALFCELNHQPGIAQTFNVIGEIARIHGDDSRARSAYEECLAICRKTGEARRICYMLNNLAYIAQHEGDHDRALSLVRQSLRLALDRKDRYDTAWALQLLAGSMGTLGQLRSAVRLLGASEAAWEQIGSLQQPTDRPEGERISAELRARLDETAFQALWEEGRKMTLDQAATYALRNQA